MVGKPKTKVIARKPREGSKKRTNKQIFKVRKDGKLDTGRPTKKTPEVLNKLKEAFGYKCSEAEACSYAGISERVLNKRKEEDENFIQQIRLWKNAYFVNIKKASYKRAINTKNKDSTEILMKIDKDFSDKVEVKGEVTLVDAVAMLKKKRLEQQDNK